MKLNTISVLAGSATVALFSGLATTAHAADPTTAVQYPFEVKLGAGFITNGGNDTAFDAGVDYSFGKTNATQPVYYQAYVDAYFKDSNALIGVGPALKFDLGNAASPNRPYVGLGLGAYFATRGSDSVGFGGKVFAGYNFTQNVIGEVDYTIADVNSTANILGVRVGYRF